MISGDATSSGGRVVNRIILGWNGERKVMFCVEGTVGGNPSNSYALSLILCLTTKDPTRKSCCLRFPTRVG